MVNFSSEAVGCREKLDKETVESCRQREQFGQAIGKFQVLQHRMVDMFIQLEQSISMTSAPAGGAFFGRFFGLHSSEAEPSSVGSALAGAAASGVSLFCPGAVSVGVASSSELS